MAKVLAELPSFRNSWESFSQVTEQAPEQAAPK